MSTDQPKKQTREERLAEALRANLRRRKSQVRARAKGDDEGEPQEPSETSGGDT